MKHITFESDNVRPMEDRVVLGQVVVQVLWFFAVSLHSSTALWKH